MADLNTMVSRLERRLRCTPDIVLMDGDLTADLTDTIVDLAAGETAKLAPSMVLETGIEQSSFFAAETMTVTSVDTLNEQVSVRRAYPDVTVLDDHIAPMYLRVNPRFTINHIRDVLYDVTRARLAPQVWNPHETTLAYEADGHYSPSVTDMMDVRYVYQLVSGQVYPLPWQFLSKDSVDQTNFPNGLIIIPSTMDSSTIYVAYKGKLFEPGFGTNTDQVDGLMILGAMAYITMYEETAGLAPEVSVVEGRVQPGSRVSAGQAMMRQFEIERDQEMNRLLALDVNVPQFAPGVVF